MEENLIQELKNNLSKLKNSITEVTIRKLDLKELDRIILRLQDFSLECDQCKKYTLELIDHVTKLQEKQDGIDKDMMINHKNKIQEISTHLQKNHMLIPEGYYQSIYMPIGLCIGILYSTLFSDNLAMGLPIGLCLGLAIGSILDGQAKKKGKMI